MSKRMTDCPICGNSTPVILAHRVNKCVCCEKLYTIEKIRKGKRLNLIVKEFIKGEK